jgi:hypothetical protein
MSKNSGWWLQKLSESVQVFLVLEFVASGSVAVGSPVAASSHKLGVVLL